MLKIWIFLAVITLLFAYQKHEEAIAFFDPYVGHLFAPTDYSAAHDVDVLMYGTSWCGYCAKARQLLDEQGITYYEYDIESSNEGYRQFQDLGGKGVPLFQIGGKVVKGFRPDRVLDLVDELYLVDEPYPTEDDEA